MSKSLSDIRRRELGTDTKLSPKHKTELIEEDERLAKIPSGGCPCYGDDDMMVIHCPKCNKERHECF